MLARIQNDLFDLGADLCVPDRGEPLPTRPCGLRTRKWRLEREIDAMNAEMAPLTSFVLPGGSPAGAALHLARTVCRRAERGLYYRALKQEGEPVSDAACRYINRLSDHLFVASRYVNGKGKNDLLWQPGQNA